MDFNGFYWVRMDKREFQRAQQGAQWVKNGFKKIETTSAKSVSGVNG